MLSMTAGRKLFMAAVWLLLASSVLIEVVLGFGRDSQLGCGLTDYSSHVWPSLNDEINAVRSSLPRHECAFVLLKSFNLLLSGATALVFTAIFLRNFRVSNTLFRRSPWPFIGLFLLGVVCFVLARYYPVGNFSRYSLLRASIMSPLITVFLMSIGLLGPLVKDDE
jgi:hypothetical protein